MSDEDYNDLKDLVTQIGIKLFAKYEGREDTDIKNLIKGEIHSVVDIGIYEAEIEYFI